MRRDGAWKKLYSSRRLERTTIMAKGGSERVRKWIRLSRASSLRALFLFPGPSIIQEEGKDTKRKEQEETERKDKALQTDYDGW